MDTNTKIALVLGASGGIGGTVARELLKRGWAVRGMVRDTSRVASSALSSMDGFEWVQGDAMVRNDTVRAASGVGVIVHAVSPPGYRNWNKLVLPMIDNTIAAAKAAGGARVVLPGTIYNYDPSETPVIDETSPQRPKSRKGALRVEIEQRMEEASQDVPGLVVRAGDFFGPGSGSSWFTQAMVKPGVPVRKIVNPGKGFAHSWAYLPDLAAAIARLLDEDQHLLPFERLQFGGVWDDTGHRMAEAIRRVTGHADLRETAFFWWLMRLLSPLGGFPREVVEIRQYWRHPVRLDNRRLESLIGPEPHTPIDRAVAAALNDLGCTQAARAETPESRPEAA